MKEKEVFAIYVNGEFKQYLMKSEVIWIKHLCQSFGKITVELKIISEAEYNRAFGK